MFQNGRAKLLPLLLMAVLFGAAGAAPVDLSPLLTEINLKPRGEYYQATVPDTLDLAERARLAVRGLTNFVDPAEHYEQYQVAFFNINPPYMGHYGMAAGNQGKIAESLLLARQMCGSRENLDIQAKMLQGIMLRVRKDGLFFNNLKNSPWGGFIDSQDQLPGNTSRVIMALMVLNQTHPDPKIGELIGKMADGICSLAINEGDAAYFSSIDPEEGDSGIGVLGYWQEMFYHGTTARALARVYATTGNKKYLDLGLRLRNFLTRPKYWQPEAAPKVVVGNEHGQFQGHHHSYTASLMALLWLASTTGDLPLKEFVRESYEYLRTFGIARIGLFGEMCTTGDMTWLAVKLSDLGVGDYWDDADSYVRNQLVEQQLTDPARLKKVVEQMPKLTKENIYEPKWATKGVTTDQVIERNVGCFLSDASNPTKVRPHTLRWTICCSGNCPPGLYAVWEAAVRGRDGVARINFLLNRASHWLDIDSYLPHEGKVVIRNKAARKISVRMPRWVDKNTVKSDVNGRTAAPFWLDNCLFFDEVKPGDVITIQFPMVETQEKYTLLWKSESMWPESTNPGNAWTPQEQPDVYVLTMRGNTLVDIAPRVVGPGLDLYLRDNMKTNKASMITVERYVPPAVVKW